MLKIKDGIGINELKKFGFNNCGECWRYSSKEAKGYVYESVIYCNDWQKILEIDYCNDKEDLNVIYDLIKADLVEKI